MRRLEQAEAHHTTEAKGARAAANALLDSATTSDLNAGHAARVRQRIATIID